MFNMTFLEKTLVSGQMVSDFQVAHEMVFVVAARRYPLLETDERISVYVGIGYFVGMKNKMPTSIFPAESTPCSVSSGSNNAVGIAFSHNSVIYLRTRVD